MIHILFVSLKVSPPTALIYKLQSLRTSNIFFFATHKVLDSQSYPGIFQTDMIKREWSAL